MSDSSDDANKVGDPGQPGVPTGDQRPTNEGNETKNIVADVHIPGPYPTGQGDPTGEPLSSEQEPTKADRDAASLGDVVEGTGLPAMDPAAANIGGSEHDKRHIPESPREEAEQLRDESYPGGAPENVDVGAGRQKGQGLPPGSVGRGEDTPQTPAT